MGQCIGKTPNESKYMAEATPIKLNDLSQSQITNQEADPKNNWNKQVEQMQKQIPGCDLHLNFKQTIQFKRKPTDESERKQTINLKSVIRSSRSNQQQVIDQRMLKLMQKDPLLASIFLRVRQNFKKY